MPVDPFSGDDASGSSLDPVLTQSTREPSPAQEKAATISQDKGVRNRLAQAFAAGPTVRQRTQSETIDLMLMQQMLGNPFSTRWIPFSQLRDMTTDLMLAFGWWMTIGPVCRADFIFNCVAQGEQVMMGNGTLKNIEDVVPNDIVLSSDGESVTLDLVEKIWSNGKKPILKITLSNGRTMRVTESHPIFSWDSWILAGDLQIGDAVCYARHTPPQDRELSKDDAYLLGVWLAEGTKRIKSYQVASLSPSVAQRLKEIADKRGWEYVPSGSETTINHRLSARHVRTGDTPMNFLREHGCWGRRTHEIRVPDSVMSANPEAVAEFLGAYILSDGCVTGKDINIVSTSERMVRDLQVLFSRFGIQTSNSHYRESKLVNKNGKTYDCRAQWVLRVCGQENLEKVAANLYLYEKHNRLLAILESRKTKRRGEKAYPPDWREEISIGVAALRRSGVEAQRGCWSSRHTVTVAAQADGNERLQKILKCGLGWAAVTKIEEDGEDYVYDMTTAAHHAFFLEAGLAHNCPDAQLAAAVDEAYRKVHVSTMMAFSNSLWFGHQPLVKQFKLGRLGGTYLDPNGKDPTADLPVWNTTADALLWKDPVVLNPSHCLPMWDDNGQMTGFKFSNMPIPHFDLISAASAYGYLVIPGHVINSDYAVWISNEKHLEFGNVFGAARTKRAYPIWWSKWFRWHVADRSFENLADPAKYVYYPVEFDEFIDPDDPNTENPLVRQARETAINTGNQIRSGATVAWPGSFETGQDGRSIPHRRWEAGYYETKNNFADMDASQKIFDIQLLRAWFIPEQSLIEGSGARTSGGSAGGTGGARMATSLANVHEESQQVLVAEYDDYINDHWIPQFVAANFPEKIGTPCEKETRAMGGLDDQVLSQVLTLIGQVHGEVLPVDVRSLLKQLNVPVLNKRQFRAEIAEISKLAQIMGPSAQPPQKVGTQGYNAGVMQTPKGNFYFQPPQRIDLSNDSSYLNSLPDTPHFQDPGVRAKSQRLRRVMKDRYDEQYKGFADFLEQQPTLHLAENGNGTAKRKSGLSAAQAKTSAAAIVGVWAMSQAPKTAGGSPQTFAAGTGSQMADLATKIALDGGRAALKGARLHAEDFDADAVQPWVQDRVKFAYDSIDQTVRDELEEWLADELRQTVDPKQVAAAAREHFADFPQTHADRVSRSETSEAFNRGTLEALQRAGVAQVQAHDASNGEDQTTDSACLARNGNVYSVADAKNVKRLHPRCTLSWTPLSTENLSVQHVDEIPPEFAEHGQHVAYDSAREILYLDAQADEQVETAVLLMLGDQLALA